MGGLSSLLAISRARSEKGTDIGSLRVYDLGPVELEDGSTLFSAATAALRRLDLMRITG